MRLDLDLKEIILYFSWSGGSIKHLKTFFLIKILKNNSYNYKEKETEENTFEQLSCLTWKLN